MTSAMSDLTKTAAGALEWEVMPSLTTDGKSTPLCPNTNYGDGSVRQMSMFTDDSVNDTDWHEYKIEWTPYYIDLFVDDKRVVHQWTPMA